MGLFTTPSTLSISASICAINKGEKHMKAMVVLAAALILAVPFTTRAADTMKAFPPAQKGMVRHVLQLPELADETVYKVELMIGKTVQTDEQNQYFFGGRIETTTLEGWGFPIYTLSVLGPMAGTLMAVDPNAPKVARFITLAGEPYLIRYNSRLPVVVYVPEGVEVRYRIWQAGSEINMMSEG
jgi:ecotin